MVLVNAVTGEVELPKGTCPVCTTNQELGLEILPLVKFRPANPRVLPSDRDTLIVAAEAHIGSVAVTDLEGLVLFQRKGERPSDTRTRLSSDAVDDAA